ncbi:DUF2231 domain-containing protein [Streptomyces sp. NPDC051569]|uniref:DUF2231 domain-containing protein n=1 Tax=Streptomyces sp. NPDC051569 TaxID=3365661 RepID=UPI0037AA9F27
MTTINGVPAHVLFVHAVVVLVPLTSLALVACAVWPSVMRRFGLALPVLALVTLVSVPLTTSAGEWLEKQVPGNALVDRHTGLGDELLPWVICLLVLAVAVWWFYRRAAVLSAGTASAGGQAAVGMRLRVAAVVLAVVVAAGSIVQVYRIGDSGAKAAWQDRAVGVAGRPPFGEAGHDVS